MPLFGIIFATFAGNSKHMIRDLFNYYLSHQQELVEKYNGKHVVVTKDGVNDAYDTEEEAYYTSVKKHGLGNFLIQLCTPGDEAYTQNFYSPRASF